MQSRPTDPASEVRREHDAVEAILRTDEDKKLIRSAFDVAVDAHKDQRRKSGW